jgi:glucosamine--fructose-6-phosphate aminotransferase (isomerizing)
VNALETMIARQGEALRAVAALDLETALETLRGPGRVLLVGTGTSFHAAELGAAVIRAGGTQARAVEAAQLRFEELSGGEAVIVITHTGETAYALLARERALAGGVALVSITGPAVDWPEAIVTPVKEEAETYTVSYTAALAVLCRLAAELGGHRSADAIRGVADRVDAVIAEPAIDQVPMPARALALVGSGPGSVTAREGALKLREGARMLCEGFDAERLLHGFAVPYGAADGLVLVDPDSDPDGLAAALGVAAEREGIAVSSIAGEGGERAPGDVLAQIPLTVRLQCLAARFARLRGTDPDVAISGAWAEPSLWTIGGPPAAG